MADRVIGSRFAAAPKRLNRKSNKQRASRAIVREPVGTALKARIEGLLKIKSGKGCGCTNLATQMDGWGIAGCERERETIIASLVNNREILETAIRERAGFIASLVAGIMPDAVLREGAGLLLSMAIEDVRKKPKPTKAVRFTGRGRKAYSGWRSEADGPVVPMGPFVSEIRHLTYFVYPKSQDSWQWNLQQLVARWPLFNGTRILGIAHDSGSAPPQEVIEYAASLGMTFDHELTAKNNEKLREVVLFLPMLKLLNPSTAGANEVVFTSHAKGQKYADASHTRDWTDIMYRSCLDNWPSVEVALRTSLMAGSFREYGLLGKWHNWAYSGTFYWWRLAEIGKREWNQVDQWFAGTESWPGKMCLPNETACLFLNDSRRLYDEPYWRSTVWPEWARYLEVRNNRT